MILVQIDIQKRKKFKHPVLTGVVVLTLTFPKLHKTTKRAPKTI